MPDKVLTISDDNKINPRALAAIAGSDELTTAFVGFGPVDPAPSLPPGTEYVWNKTDGAGTLLDIVSGVA